MTATSPAATSEPIDEQLTELADHVAGLLDHLDYEIGRDWMSLELRLKIEEIEILLGRRGTSTWVPPE